MGSDVPLLSHARIERIEVVHHRDPPAAFGKKSVDEMAETLAFVAHWTGLVPGDG